MIRKYREQDLEELLEVWHKGSLIAHPFLGEDFLEAERRAITEKYIPVAETWVYTTQSGLAGFIALIGNEVGAIFVHPDSQGRGIGRALMDQARGLRETLELDVFKANRIGRAFYERYGFEFVKEHVHQQTGHPLLRLRLESGRGRG